MRRVTLAVLLSAIVHGGATLAVARLPKEPPPRKPTSIAIVEPKKPPRKPHEEKPKEPEREPPKPAAQTPAPPKPKAPPPPNANTPPPPVNAAANAAPAAAGLDNLPNLGIAMGNGTGAGIAVPAGGGQPAVQAGGDAKSKDLRAQGAKPAADDGCSEEAVKPKPSHVEQPQPTEAAKAASLDGKVKLQLRVDATGKVVDVKVIAGVGYGCDEAAVAAARRSTFVPATRCGKPVDASFNLVFRFAAAD